MTRKKKNQEPPAIQSSQPDEAVPRETILNSESVQPSQEDLLAEARRALIEEESQVKENVGILKRMTGRLRGTGILRPLPKEPSPDEEKILSHRLEETTEPPAADESALEEETKALLDALEKAESAVPSEVEAEAPPTPATAVEAVPVESPALTVASASAIEPGYHALREVALEGYEEPSPESLIPPQPSFNEQIGNLAGQVQYKTLIRITIASLTAVVCMATFLIGSWALNLRPLSALQGAPPPTVTATLPPAYPIQVRMPGGWMFVLSRGRVANGKWAPEKAEWLEGTEICRWVSLPWSEQLEAVFLTLKTGDRLDLVMSNYDRWSYRVRSVKEVQLFDLAGMDKNYPSLLLILTNPESDIRVVVEAAP